MPRGTKLEGPLKGRKKKQSCFLITINSNCNSNSVDEDFIPRFKAAVYETMKTEKYYKQMIVFKNEDAEEDDPHDTYIDEIEDSDSFLEIGKKDKIHSHTVIKIHHYSYIQLDRNFFEKKMFEEFPKEPGKNYYVNLKSFKSKEHEQFLKSHEQRVIEYSLKDGRRITEASKID